MDTLSDATALPELSFDDLLDESPIKRFRTRSISDDTIDTNVNLREQSLNTPGPKRKINPNQTQSESVQTFVELPTEKIAATTTLEVKSAQPLTPKVVSMPNPTTAKAASTTPLLLNNKIALTQSSSKQPQKVVKIATATGKVLGKATTTVAGSTVLSQQTLGSVSMIGGKTAIKTANGQIVYLQRAPTATTTAAQVINQQTGTFRISSSNVPKSTIITNKPAANVETAAPTTAAASTANAAGNKTVSIQFVRSADGKLVPLKTSTAGVKNTLTLSPTVAAQLAGKKLVNSAGNQLVFKTATTGAGATTIKSSTLTTTNAANATSAGAATVTSNAKPGIKLQKITPQTATLLNKTPLTSTTTTILNASVSSVKASVTATETAPTATKPAVISTTATAPTAAGGKVLVQSTTGKQLVVSNSQIIKLSPKPNTASGTGAATGSQLQPIQIPGKPGIQYVRVVPAPKKATIISEASTAAAAKLLNTGVAATKTDIVRAPSATAGKIYLASSPKVEGSAVGNGAAGSSNLATKVQKTIVTVPTIRNISHQEKLLTTSAAAAENAGGVKTPLPMAITVLRPKSKILEINSEIKRMTTPSAASTGGTDITKKFVSGADGKRYVVIQQTQPQKLTTGTGTKIVVKAGNESNENAVKSFIICKNNQGEPTSTVQIKMPAPTVQQQTKTQIIKAESTLQQQQQFSQIQQLHQPKQFFLEDKNVIPTLSSVSTTSANNNSKFVPLQIKEELMDMDEINFNGDPLARGGVRRKHCNCSKSQCLKLYCDCFANGEFCQDCTCKDCFNSLQYEDERLRAIRSCLERNPSAFKPKITSQADQGDARLHNKGCNCKRSGCLKNYCECFEAKIPCSNNCKCVGCRNVEDRPDLDMDPIDPKILETIASASNATNTIARAVSNATNAAAAAAASKRAADAAASDSDTEAKRRRCSQDGSTTLMAANQSNDAVDAEDDDEDKLNQTNEKRSTNFITQEVIDATIQCMISQADECLKNNLPPHQIEKMVIEELGRCLVEIIDFSIRNTDNSFTQN